MLLLSGPVAGDKISHDAIMDFFEEVNIKRDFTVTDAEFELMINRLGLHITRGDARDLYSVVDINNNGISLGVYFLLCIIHFNNLGNILSAIAFQEFYAFCVPEETAIVAKQSAKYFEAFNMKELSLKRKTEVASRMLDIVRADNKSTFADTTKYL